MNINLYNLLSQLIPGFIFYVVIIFTFDININNIPTLPAISIAYIMGYLINAIGGWLERFFYWSWGGEPLKQLLETKSCGRIGFYELKKLKKLLDTDIISNKEKLQFFKNLAKESEKVKDMNNGYIFSRSILVCLIVGYLVLMLAFFEYYLFNIVSIILIIAFWYRAKERAFYYAREVLYVAVDVLGKKNLTNKK